MVDSIQDFRKLASEKSTGALRSPRKKHRVPTWRLPTWIWKVPWSWPMIFMDHPSLSRTPKLEWFDCVWSIGLPSLFRKNRAGCKPWATASQAVNLMVSPLIRGHWFQSRHTKDPKDPKAWWIESRAERRLSHFAISSNMYNPVAIKNYMVNDLHIIYSLIFSMDHIDLSYLMMCWWAIQVK